MRKRTRKVAAKLQHIYETAKFFVSFCMFSGQFCFILAQKAKEKHIYRPKTAFLLNATSVLTKHYQCSYTTAIQFLLSYFTNSSSLATKVDEFGHQGSQNYIVTKFPL
jgi:hypothetical protein